MTRGRKLAAVGLAAIALAAAAAIVFHRANATLSEAREKVAGENSTVIDESRLDRPTPAGYESIGAPAEFRDAASFQGKLYLCAASGVFAYDADGTLRDRYRTGFELPSTKLVAAAVAASGARELYVATESAGLLAFDGRIWRQIRPRDPALRRLTAVLPLETGRVLLGTERAGLLVYDGQTIVPFHAALAGLHVTTLAGNEGDLWIGTIDRGVIHWRGGQSENFSEAAGLPDPQVLSLALAGETAYVGTPLGVAEFTGGRFRRKLADGVMARSMLVRAGKLAGKLAGNLLIGTLDEGVMEMGLAHGNQAVPARIERLLELEGEVYALSGDGLYRAGTLVLHPDAAVLADGNVSALAADKAGRLWVGYFDRGLDVVTNGRAQHIEDEHVFCVNRIVADARGDSRGDPHADSHTNSRGDLTAVATANGLVMFDAAARPRQVFGREQGLIASHVTDVLFTPGGTVIATPAGITIAGEGGMRSLYAFHGLVNNHVYALAGGNGKTLAGTLGGISMLDGDRPTLRYTTANSPLKQNWVTAIVAAGNEWFAGTYGDGVVRIDADGRLWREASRETSQAEAGIVVNPGAMIVTPSHIYAGTLGAGLQIFDRQTRRWHGSSRGLPSLNVTALASRDGIVYIGTDNGLIRVTEADIQ